LIYSLSITFYFIDFMKQNWRINQLAYRLLWIVWLMQTALLINQLLIEKRFPVLSLNEGLFFYAWILITFSLVINRLFNIHFIVLFTNIFSFFILLLSFTLNANQHIYEGIKFIHEILIIHITLAFISYGFFTISFMLAIMYLLQYWFLRNKKGIKWMFRFGDLKQLDSYSYYAVIIGGPLLLISLILGFVWASIANAEFYLFDVTTIESILVLIIYIIYLLLIFVFKYIGKPIAVYNTVAFLLLLINYFLFNTFSNFHF